MELRYEIKLNQIWALEISVDWLCLRIVDPVEHLQLRCNLTSNNFASISLKVRNYRYILNKDYPESDESEDADFFPVEFSSDEES